MNEFTMTPDLRDARLRQGLSQERVARLADVSLSFVRNCERGWRPVGNRPSPSFERIVRVLCESDT